MGRVAEVVGFLILIAAAGCFAGGFSTKHWREGNLFKYGLWENCLTVAQLESCTNIEWDIANVTNFWTRSLMVAAAVLLGIGIFLEVFSWCCDGSTRDCLLTAEAVFDILGGLFALAAAGTFTGLVALTVAPSSTTVSQLTSAVLAANFGYSLYLVYASGVLFIIGGSIMCCAKGQQSEQVVPMQTTAAWSTATAQQMPLGQMPVQNVQLPNYKSGPEYLPV